MQADYPAAHSMDTCFFAVDRDGHVACFDTGEAGAVPTGSVAGDDAYELRRRLASLPRVEVVHELRGHTLPDGSMGWASSHIWSRGSSYPVLMFLASLDPVREEIAAGRAVEVPASEGVAVLFPRLSEELSQRLHESDVCRGCVLHLHSEDREEYSPDVAARGLFCYSHITENWISGPYGLVRRPAQPIHIDQLPPQLRYSVKALQFDSLSFAETVHIQPIEHGACESWEWAYMDATGKNIRPVPGREQEYADNFSELSDIAPNLNIEPPPGQRPDKGAK